MSRCDGYDYLCNMAQLDGVRISPLFRVFFVHDGWRVCGTNIEGDAVFTHEKHGDNLFAATLQAATLNAELGARPVDTFIEHILALLEGRV